MNGFVRWVTVLACGSLVALAGCGKKPATAETTAAKEIEPSVAPRATAVATPAVPAAGAPAAAVAVATNTIADTTAKLAAADWALRQDEIKNDPNGQWAASATASSRYGDDTYSPTQATGAPDVEKYLDDGRAWAPKTADSGIEWLDLKYAKPVHATEVRIRESCGSGAIIRLELVDAMGLSHMVWSGTDPTTELNYLMIKFPKTAYKTDRVKITLATNAVLGWNEIDAVQLVGTED